MFLKNKNIISKARRSKVTDYAALRLVLLYSVLIIQYMYACIFGLSLFS